ncbi:MAG: universal stress protein [Flaviflexus sp.]|nr:universal stress protein [Flaviflexus sp.]
MTYDKPVVVGIDNSASAQEALDFGAAQAKALGCPLRIVRIYSPLYGISGVDPTPPSDDRKRLEDSLERAQAHVAEKFGLEASTEWESDDPAVALTKMSSDAALMVLGARGLGAMRRIFVGSVSTKVATYADCPVIVVREGEHDPEGPIVVGMAPEKESLTALTFGFVMARAHGCRLEVVRAHQHAAAAIPNMPEGETKEAAKESARTAVSRSEEIFQKYCEYYSDVEANFVHVRGHASEALVDRAPSSRMIVVASHGKGELRATVMGSVSMTVLHNAPIVAVTHPPHEAH